MFLTFEQVLSEQKQTAKWIANFLTNIDKSKKASDQTAGYLATRAALLTNYWDSFSSTHRTLMRFKEFADSDYDKDDTYEATVERYVLAKSELENRITELQQTPNTSNSTATPTVAAASNVTPASVLQHFQLPKIELPTFDGNPLAWESFRDLFKSMVFNATGLSDCQRLQYLQSKLTGEASDLLKNTPVTDSAFKGAWEDLETRYGNPRIISAFHMNALFNVNMAVKSSPSEIRRLIDSFRQSIRAFQALRKPVAHWDEFFVYLMVIKLDRTTRLVWETSLADSREIPSFKQLVEFLENRVHALSFTYTNTLSSVISKESQKNKSTPDSNYRVAKTALTVTKPQTTPSTTAAKTSNATAKTKSRANAKKTCLNCTGSHFINYCPDFRNLPVSSRRERAVDLKLCFNCLRDNHLTTGCTSTSRCLTCNNNHHTLLHVEPNRQLVPNFNGSGHNAAALPNARTVGCCSFSSVFERAVLIATARVRIVNKLGESLVVRALLDTCAEASLITEAAAQALNLRHTSVDIPVSGVQGHSAGHANRAVTFELKSPRDETLSLDIQALVLPKITNLIPSSSVQVKPWPHLVGLPLADPEFAKPGDIDLLLGANITGHLLLDQSHKGSLDEPVARLTPFGWVIMGPVDALPDKRYSPSPFNSIHLRTIFSEEKFWEDPITSRKPKIICHCAFQPSLKGEDDCVSCDLKKFWELEELPREPLPSEDDVRCEQFFVDTFRRNGSGRYIVRLPFKLDPLEQLTPNKAAAMAVLVSNEKRFSKDPVLKSEYSSFMNEYSLLNHMSQSSAQSTGIYLPHHGVWKTDPKPKLRVVFNASHNTNSGKSLNDCLLPGPKLQTDLWTVISRARLFKIFFTADIVKMFRQILVDPEDTPWQKILWRSNEGDKVQEYSLNTVTYGTNCAPFLALRTLIQLAKDEKSRFPLGAQVILETSYVDDFLAGGDDVASALETKKQLIQILNSAGFSLSKWASNASELGSDSSLDSKTLNESETISTLGLTWNPGDDFFSLKVDATRFKTGPATKRSVLSDVARLFDPLGWYAPSLIQAKILIQNIWLTGLDWDQPLPLYLSEQWISFRSALPNLEAIKIPRWLGTFSFLKERLELHVFCDASERAYATSVYLRIVGEHSSTTNLLMAKSKVAPVKTVSIPRLELCSAVLASKLVIRLRTSLKLGDTPIFAHSDSQVALAWIKSHASRWSVFVAHRVSKIQSLVAPNHWRHVRTSLNPADLATRGISPTDLKDSTLWWHGPSTLLEPGFTPVSFEKLEYTDVEARFTPQEKFVAVETLNNTDLLSRFSKLGSLIRITSYCLRFIRNLPKRKALKEVPKGTPVPPLSTSETSHAYVNLISLSQKAYFTEELKHLSENKPLYQRSKIKALRPFLDANGLLRVGGRLEFQETLSFDEKHPIILHKDCPLANLIAQKAHLETLHGGPQLLISHIIRKFWITHVHTLAKNVVNQCVTCTRYAGKTLTQVMSNLPKERINSIRPFLATGVDYAGPIQLRTTKGRGHKSYKGYICVFVCMASKAIHLEVVSDLTSKAFIQAFIRFVSRRGHCQTLVSDNGPTFRGADRELREMFNEASTFYKEVSSYLLDDNTEWTFIPPLSPHMGGLWEAGVKSVKHHLRRVIGNHTLTFEEMDTLLCQIEACLNSRPLVGISKNPMDLAPLTPGHILIGHALTTVPERGFIDLESTPASRFRLISRMRDDFWRRWKSDYLQTLQPRARWRDVEDPILLNSLVLVTDENTPPAKWPIGRIIKLHPAKDQMTRRVTVRTASGEYVRPIVKLCLLPVAPVEEVPARFVT